MGDILHPIIMGIAHHLTAMGFGSGVFLLAMGTTWPSLIPKSAQDVWTWIGNALKVALPVRQLPHEPKVSAEEKVSVEVKKTEGVG